MNNYRCFLFQGLPAVINSAGITGHTVYDRHEDLSEFGCSAVGNDVRSLFVQPADWSISPALKVEMFILIENCELVSQLVPETMHNVPGSMSLP